MAQALPVVKRDTWCKHRTSFEATFKTCKVGVDFHQFPKQHDQIPCLGENAAARALCPKFENWTAEEIAKREADIQKRMQAIAVIRPAIVRSVKETGVRAGRMPCPSCKTGTLSYSQASNGHVHAKCSTDGCASWME